MNLTLQRNNYRADGIFSSCSDESGLPVMVTLEHAYEDGSGGFDPKIPPGQYICTRGPHRLNGMTEDFETFEINGVEGHEGLLFHWGNYNRDSEGCILVGKSDAMAGDGTDMITSSRVEFADFMALQSGLDRFVLTVLA